MIQHPVCFLIAPFVAMPEMLLAAMPFAPSSFLFLVVRPGAPTSSSILAPSSTARSPVRSVPCACLEIV